MSYKGKFRPTFIKKYKGDPTNIVYRSLWENLWSVIRIQMYWSGEVKKHYRSPVDNKIHRYFQIFTSSQRINWSDQKYLIEVKPFKQTVEPQVKRGKQKDISMKFITNQAKWKAAREFCKDRLWEFKVLTENELGIKW